MRVFKVDLSNHKALAVSQFYLLFLALLQGLTEFLPVSSSAHLELLHKATGQSQDDLTLDVAVHVGTLGAVIIYFKTEVFAAFQGSILLAKGVFDDPKSRLALCLIVATVPVVIVGLILKVSGLDDAVRSLAVIGWAMIIFGLLLWWADRKPAAVKSAGDWNLPDAIKLGFWQAVALIPGTSRSGITITGALRLGYSRAEAAKIAMLMSIPTIIASGVLLGADAVENADVELLKSAAIAALLAFVAALGALAIMMRLLKRVSYTPYVVYRLILGAILLWIAYS